MAENRGLTNRSLSVLPLLVMGVSHLSLPPLQTMFELEPRLMYGWYVFALLLCVVVYRRSGVVKDHEYNRAKAMRKIRYVYEAEERGVWETDAQLDATMDKTTQQGLSRSVSEISGEAPEMELNEDDKVEVQMLNEANHIVRANARVTGSATLDDEVITGTMGAQKKIGPMDRFLDGVFGLFGIDSRADREAQRQARLKQAANVAPVTAQRPVAPLRMNKDHDESEINMTSMSDSGGVETVMSTSGQVRDSDKVPSNSKVVPEVSESLESMAMMGMAPSASPSIATTGPVCRGCGAPVNPSERFCPHCGLDL
ncbi:MAG: hypothetical protein CMA15_05405 [Euryarchaeota archaeon]|nr:hypothetical protein [Euryarchaeota archaeon]